MQQIGNNKYKLVSNAFQNQLKLAFQFFLIANPKVPGEFYVVNNTVYSVMKVRATYKMLDSI